MNSKQFSSNNPIIYVHGGLGNQLFQIAAANVIFKDKEYFIDLGEFNELNQHVLKFTFSNKLSILPSRKKRFFEQKLINLIIRVNYRPNKKSRIQPFFRFADFFSKFLLSRIYLAGREVITSTNLGFDSQFIVSNPYSYTIGYFQSSIWPLDSINIEFFRDLELFRSTPEFEYLRDLSITEKPLVVHIRLGDYLAQKSFGLLTKDYYKKAIETLWSTKKYRKIWIFSNEPSLTESYIPSHLIEMSRRIDLDLDDAATTLQLMRFGYGYVLSNSTFGWWGAFLSANGAENVIAPNPWFRYANDPDQIIPLKWSRMDGWLV